MQHLMWPRAAAGALALVALISAACAPAAAPAPTQAPAKPAAQPTSAPAKPAAQATAAPAKPAESKPAAQPTAAPKAAAAPAKEAAAKPAAPAKELTTIKMGAIPPSLSNAGIYIAEEKGYFAEQGIQLEMVQFRSGDEQAAFLARGDIDVGSGGPNAGVYNGAARGITTKIVADKGHAAKGFEWFRFMANKDLYDQGAVRSIKDLKGRTLAIVGRGASGEVAAMKALEQNGIKPEEVNITVLSFPDMIPALANKSVDVAFAIEPMVTTMIQQGIGVPIASSNDFYPNQQIAVIMYSEKFLKEQPDLAKRWMVAYVKGLRDYNDAFAKGEGKEEVVNILVERKAAPNAEFVEKMNKVALNPNGTVNVESIQQDMEFYVSTGQVSERVSMDKIVDQSFTEHAVQVLGKYE